MKDKALRLALEALTNAYWPTESDLMPAHNIKECAEAITAIKEALANEALDKMAENARELGLDYEPEQPKVRTGNCLRVGVCASEGHKIAPQRTWVGLTNDEVNNFAAGCHLGNSVQGAIYKAEAKLKEKNT